MSWLLETENEDKLGGNEGGSVPERWFLANSRAVRVTMLCKASGMVPEILFRARDSERRFLRELNSVGMVPEIELPERSISIREVSLARLFGTTPVALKLAKVKP